MPKADEVKSPMIFVLVFVVVGIFMFVNIAYVLSLVDFINLKTAPDVEDTLNFTVDNNWNDSGTINNLVDGGTEIYVTKNEVGNWTSDIIEAERSRVLTAYYEADMVGGAGNLTIDAWNDLPVNQTPDESKTIALDTGINSEVFNLSQQNYFRATITLDDESGTSDNRPSVDYLNLEYEIVEDEKRGVEKSELTMIVFLLLVFAFFMLIIELFYYLEE